MLTLKKELRFDEGACPFCGGIEEADFTSVKFSRAFLLEIYKKDKDALPHHPEDFNDKDAMGAAWLFYHVLSEGCLQYEADSLLIRRNFCN